MASYQKLLNPFHILAEKKEEYTFFSERHLQAIWLDQKYFRNICTANGEPIEIVSPGIWNAEAGPDFLKAHLRIGQKEYRGDIELHLTEDDWYHHQHHLDPRYNQTVFHLSLWKPKNPKTIVNQKNEVIISGHLESFLTISLSRIVQLVDLDLYPYRKFIGSGRCAQALYKSLNQDKIVQLFSSAADWRLEQKFQYLQYKELDSSSQLLLGIAMALGYKNNAEPFGDLFLELKKFSKESEEQLLARCLGMTGFFSQFYLDKWQDSNFYIKLRNLWISLQSTENELPLKLNQVRPLNHPIRRFVYLIKMMKERRGQCLYRDMEEYWSNNYATFSGKWRKLRDQLRDFIPSFQDEYWNSHYLFERELRKEYLPLIGEDLKDEMLINVFLPILYNAINERRQEKESKAFEEFYSSLGGSQNSKVKYLTHRFFGDSLKGDLMSKANMQQGAFQIHRDFCIHYEASCEGCPFVERYHQLF